MIRATAVPRAQHPRATPGTPAGTPAAAVIGVARFRLLDDSDNGLYNDKRTNVDERRCGLWHSALYDVESALSHIAVCALGIALYQCTAGILQIPTS